MEEKRFTIELNEKQLDLLKIALEEYFRIRMNQWNDLADSLTSMGVDFSPENPNHDWIFDRFIDRRNCIQCIFETVGKILWGHVGWTDIPKTQEMMIVEDMWQVFRYTLWNECHKPGEDDWCVDARTPMKFSDEPLPTCRRKEK